MVRFHVSQNGMVYDKKPITPENYNGVTDDSSNCIGSDCMMWQWFDPQWDGTKYLYEKNEEGYCGLGRNQ